MSQQLCLKWNNHSSAFEKLLCNLQMKDVYSDGTILCQGKFYPVHRFVLSTCSEYFEEMFQQCVRLKDKHPFIIVKDIHPNQMEALLNYMYKGEVNVPQEMLPELIKAAEVFKIKGLAVSDEEPNTKASRKRSNASSPSSITKKSRKFEEKFSSNVIHSNQETINQESNDSQSIEDTYEPDISTPNFPIKSEPIDVSEMTEISTDNSKMDSVNSESVFNSKTEAEHTSTSFYESNEMEDYNELFDPGQSTSSWDENQTPNEEMMNDQNQSNDGFDIHAMTIPENIYEPRNPNETPISDPDVKRKHRFKCSSCTYTTDRISNLKSHFRIHTGEKPFKCYLCPYKGVQKQHLTGHLFSVHNIISNRHNDGST